jgi:hypothetical protein
MQQTIASVYFKECSAARPYIPHDRSCGYGAYPFLLAAADPGEFKTLIVPDMLERQYVIEGQYLDTPVFANDFKGDGGGIAKDLVNEWSRNTLGPGGDVGPGIIVCAGDAPTEGELMRARNRQLRWCEWRMLTAEDNWTKDKKTLVTEDDRAAARWYLAQCELDNRPLPLAFKNLEWVNVTSGERVEMAECSMCFARHDKRAAMCPNGHIVDFNRYQNYLRHKQEVEEALRQFAAPEAAPGAPEVAINPPMPPMQAASPSPSAA